MLKETGLLAMGGIAGAAVYFLVLAERATEAPGESEALVASPAGETIAAGIAATAELAAYRAAANIADVAAIENALERALAEPYSAERQIQIRALFDRLAAIDMGRAVRFADTPGFDAGLVADAFRAWAANDPDAALLELGLIDDPVMQRTIAEALLDVLGFDAATIERIASSLPLFQWVDFQAAALARLAESDPVRAIDAALSLGDPALRSSAALRVGAAWVSHDPAAAIAAGNSLPPELQAAWRSSVAREWARLDADAFLGFARNQPQIADLLPGLMHAMAVDPERVFEVAAEHDPLPIGEGFPAYATVERTAFTGVVMSDPQRAFSILEALPEGDRRRGLTIALAESYGRTRPEEAIAWARSQVPRDAVLETSVIAYGADFETKFQWMYEYENPEDLTPYARNPLLATWMYIANIGGALAGGHPDRARIADQLFARGDEKSQAVLQRLTVAWVGFDAEGALDWMLGKGAVDPVLAVNIGSRIAARDAAAAAAYVDRIPQDLRGDWLRAVASEYGRQDPAGAASWLARSQGEPGFEDLLGRAATQAAQSDPEVAAQMLGLAQPGAIDANVAAQIAAGWSRSNLAGAADWAASLEAADSRSIAISRVASNWASRDPAAAQRWAAGLAEGPARDEALAGVLNRLARGGFDTAIDPRALDGFSSDSLRNRQVGEIIASVAASDPDRAQSLLQRLATDAATRREGEEAIERARLELGL